MFCSSDKCDNFLVALDFCHVDSNLLRTRGRMTAQPNTTTEISMPESRKDSTEKKQQRLTCSSPARSTGTKYVRTHAQPHTTIPPERPHAQGGCGCGRSNQDLSSVLPFFRLFCFTLATTLWFFLRIHPNESFPSSLSGRSKQFWVSFAFSPYLLCTTSIFCASANMHKNTRGWKRPVQNNTWQKGGCRMFALSIYPQLACLHTTTTWLLLAIGLSQCRWLMRIQQTTATAAEDSSSFCSGLNNTWAGCPCPPF